MAEQKRNRNYFGLVGWGRGVSKRFHTVGIWMYYRLVRLINRFHTVGIWMYCRLVRLINRFHTYGGNGFLEPVLIRVLMGSDRNYFEVS